VIPYADDRRPGALAAAVWLIVAVNIYAFYLELSAARPEYFIDSYALVPYNITHGIELPAPAPHPYALTFVTSMFLHGSISHIFWNMLFLVVFGPRIERHLGHLGFVVLYLLGGLAGGIAQIWVSPNSHVPLIGASGAIAAILGAYIVTFPAARIGTILPIGCFPLFLQLPAAIVIGIWAALQFFLGFGTVDPRANLGGVAYFAHIGGFSFGAVVVGFYDLFGGRNRGRGPRSRR
jgi:membrane associated rhomboid family serine protease